MLFWRMKIQWSGNLIAKTTYVMMTLERWERKPARTGISKLQDGRVTGDSVWLYDIIIKINSKVFRFHSKSPNNTNYEQGAASWLIYSFLVGSTHNITSKCCQLRVSGSLTVLWIPKLGSTHHFTITWSLGSIWFLRHRTSNFLPHTRSEAGLF